LIQDKYGVKMYVEDGEEAAIIHLSGKEIRILETVREEIEIKE
jgi:hypothetical protein